MADDLQPGIQSPPAGTEGSAPSLETPGQAPDAVTPPASATGEPSETTAQPGPEPEDERAKAIKELIRMRHRAQEAEKEAAYLKGRLESQPQNQPPKPDEPPKKPLIDNYATYDEYEAAKDKYIEDMIDWKTDQKVKAVAPLAENPAEKMHKTWLKRVEAAAAVNPDITEAMQTIGPKVTAPMAAYLKGSEDGPELMLHLYENPAVLSRLAGLENQAVAIAELVRLGDKIKASASNPPTKTISNAPQPHKTVGGSSPPPTDDLVALASSDKYEYIRRRNAEEAKGR